MCSALYPQLKELHHKLRTDDISVPHDASDLRRCMNFLKEVPEAKENLSMVKSVNGVWSKLVDQWDALEEKNKNNDHQGCKEIIKQCKLDGGLKFKI